MRRQTTAHTHIEDKMSITGSPTAKNNIHQANGLVSSSPPPPASAVPSLLLSGTPLPFVVAVTPAAVVAADDNATWAATNIVNSRASFEAATPGLSPAAPGLSGAIGDRAAPINNSCG